MVELLTNADYAPDIPYFYCGRPRRRVGRDGIRNFKGMGWKVSPCARMESTRDPTTVTTSLQLNAPRGWVSTDENMGTNRKGEKVVGVSEEALGFPFQRAGREGTFTGTVSTGGGTYSGKLFAILILINRLVYSKENESGVLEKRFARSGGVHPKISGKCGGKEGEVRPLNV